MGSAFAVFNHFHRESPCLKLSQNNSAVTNKSPHWKKIGPPIPGGRASSVDTVPPTWFGCVEVSRLNTPWRDVALRN